MKFGTLQAILLNLFSVEKHPDAYHHAPGFTDDELERRLGRSHQSVSAARNTLMRRGTSSTPASVAPPDRGTPRSSTSGLAREAS